MRFLELFYLIGLTMLVSTSFFTIPIESKGLIGVDYGLNTVVLSLSQTVALLQSKNITRVRRYEAHPIVTRAFVNAGIDLLLGVPNEDVPKLASSSIVADNWVLNNVLPFPTASISAIIVGNEWFYSPSNDPSLLLPAMQNILNALRSKPAYNDSFLLGIKVSTSHAFNVISTYFPPSTAKFKDSIAPFMGPVVSFLVTTESFFMVDIFPYLIAAANPQDKDLLQFAIFNSTRVVQDPYTHLDYRNLFDLQLDAVYAAIESLLSSPSPQPPSSYSSGCVCSCVCTSDFSCICSSSSNPTSSPVMTRNSSSCECIANHINSEIYISQLKATPELTVHPSSGHGNGPGGYKSSKSGSPPRSSLASMTTNGNKISYCIPNPPKNEEVEPAKLFMQATNIDERQFPLSYSSHNGTQALSHAQLTSPSMSLPSSLFNNNDIGSLQHELKPFGNSSLLPKLGGFPKKSPSQVSTLRSTPKSSSSSSFKSSPISIKKPIPSSRTSSLQTTHNEVKLWGRGYSQTSSATSYGDVCTLRGALQVASIENAHTYNQRLIDHVLEASGTPANPTTPIIAYIFELFDEDIGGINYGLYYADGTPVYPINFLECTCNSYTWRNK